MCVCVGGGFWVAGVGWGGVADLCMEGGGGGYSQGLVWRTGVCVLRGGGAKG